MDLLMNLNKLEYLWIGITGGYVLKAIYDKIHGGGSSCNNDFTGILGILRFKKRSVSRWLAGITVNSILVYSTYRCYLTGVQSYEFVSSIVSYLGETSHEIDYMSIIVASTLLFAHLLRRGHQSVFLSVHSESTQNILDFLGPLLYNLTAGFVILSAAPSLSTPPTDSWLSLSAFKIQHGISIVIFFLSSYLDKQCQKSLVQCRKNRAGHIVTDDHKIPKGGLFDFVSCPNFFLEIINNIAIGLTLGFGHRPWWILTGYIIVSHATRAVDRHRWFLKKYDNYPKDRNSIIPYLF